jgi:hypothetical protein
MILSCYELIPDKKKIVDDLIKKQNQLQMFIWQVTKMKVNLFHILKKKML